MFISQLVVSYASLVFPERQHLPNVELHSYCPQMFLYLDFQSRDDVSDSKQTFAIKKSDNIPAGQTSQARAATQLAFCHPALKRHSM